MTPGWDCRGLSECGRTTGRDSICTYWQSFSVDGTLMTLPRPPAPSLMAVHTPTTGPEACQVVLEAGWTLRQRAASPLTRGVANEVPAQ